MPHFCISKLLRMVHPPLANCYAGILKHELQEPGSSIIAPDKFPVACGLECQIREVPARTGRDEVCSGNVPKSVHNHSDIYPHPAVDCAERFFGNVRDSPTSHAVLGDRRCRIARVNRTPIAVLLYSR